MIDDKVAVLYGNGKPCCTIEFGVLGRKIRSTLRVGDEDRERVKDRRLVALLAERSFSGRSVRGLMCKEEVWMAS